MTRRSNHRLRLLLGGLVLCGAPLAAAQPAGSQALTATPAAAPPVPASAAVAPVVRAEQIAPGLYLLNGGSGANATLLAGEEGALVVDSKGDLASAEAALAAIAEVHAGEIRYLLNTHVHPDHTGGNLRFGERGVRIVAHEDVLSILSAGQRGGPPEPPAARPVMTFGDGETVTLSLNGETVRFRHMPPAHTEDNCLVHFVNADVWHLGDLYSPIRYPVLAGGTLQGFLDGLDQVLAESDADSRFVPGNGGVMGRADLEAYRAMLADVRDRVAALVAEGRSLDEMLAAAPTAAYDGTWGSPERFLPALYRELGGAAP